jgi:cysteine desulfurase
MIAYLDNNATTQPTPGVVAAVREALEVVWANPSSPHRAGQEARRIVELARRRVADLLGCRHGEIVFTSGGTESIHIALRGVMGRAMGPAGGGDRRALVISRLEHPAAVDLAKRLGRDGVEVRWIRSTPEGVIDLDHAASLIDDSVALVSCQWANNETGALQPVEHLGDLCRRAGALFHTDATQAVGKEPVSAGVADLLTLSGHKFHAPKGIGALYIRRGGALEWPAAGSQEQGRRAGTENVPGIAGLGAAAGEARAWLADQAARRAARALRDHLEQRLLKMEGACVNGPAPEQRLWNTSNIGFAGAQGELLLMALSERGVCVSAGAACASGSVETPNALAAMGVAEEVAAGSLRISLSRFTTRDEVEAGAEAIEGAVRAQRAPVRQGQALPSPPPAPVRP